MCNLHWVGFDKGIRVFDVLVGVVNVWEFLWKFLLRVTGFMCIRVFIYVCVLCVVVVFV